MFPPNVTSFKIKAVTLKYKWFLKIGILALDQEGIIFIVSKFEFAQCKGGRPVQMKSISRGRYAIFVSYTFIV